MISRLLDWWAEMVVWSCHDLDGEGSAPAWAERRMLRINARRRAAREGGAR